METILIVIIIARVFSELRRCIYSLSLLAYVLYLCVLVEKRLSLYQDWLFFTGGGNLIALCTVCTMMLPSLRHYTMPFESGVMKHSVSKL